MRRNATTFLPHAAWRAARAGFTLMELMVVIGIAALLLTISATAFFGASREENLVRSRDQLRDLLLSARQRACIEGAPYVVICYNTTTKITVGSKEETIDQGRFALFRSVGRVWPANGDCLAAPFGFQRDQLSTLAKRERLINLDDPEKEASGGSSQFMRVEAIARDPDRLSDDPDTNNKSVDELNYDYYPTGGDSPETLRLVASKKGGDNDYGFYVARLESDSGETKPFPLGVRATSTFSLPSGYKFDSDRTAFVFLPDGRAREAVSISAATSVGGTGDAPEFSVSVSEDGEVDIK